MEKIHSFSVEGQADLRIVEHFNMQKHPESVQQMISLASTPEEKDIILVATLAAASAAHNQKNIKERQERHSDTKKILSNSIRPNGRRLGYSDVR